MCKLHTYLGNDMLSPYFESVTLYVGTEVSSLNILLWRYIVYN